MLASNSTSHDEPHQKQAKIDNLLLRIQSYSSNTTAMPEACKALVVQCESACATARQVPPSDADQSLFTVLERILVFVTKMSTSFYTKCRTADYLERKMKTLRSDLSKAVDTQKPLVPHVLQQPEPQGDAVDVHSMYSIEVDKMKEELMDRQNELKKAQKPEGKAQLIFNTGVTCIGKAALDEWETLQTVEVDEASMKPVRFGHLGMATVGGAVVLIKRIGEIQGTTKTDTVKRCKALAHWLRRCKGMMKIDYIQRPDLVIYGPIRAETLDVYLAQQPGLSLEAKWMLAFKVASTTSYIHECKIIHRNIRAESVFMVMEASGKIEPKLAGFEACRKEDLGFRSVGQTDEFDLWDAPEKPTHGSSFATDVYAFGVLMYEIAMRQPPVWINHPNVSHEMKYKQNASHWVGEAYSFSPTPKYITLMQQCLSATHTDRPAMSTIFDTLAEGYE
ncbi:hypothetical protein DFQ27_000301 [Actinomortierella ambigua]|uniref:Protein kinase domain-containing protein n=1 Tax=Actinomortierella ambigua TaxID=1343610 RepID=A0A9P6PL57_9FUNG|nr:hypothetical protein DFQ27_000301 [Actinomortierella ambigua]